MRILRHAGYAVLYGLLGSFLVLVGGYAYLLESRPDLEVWHRAELDEEFTTERAADIPKDWNRTFEFIPERPVGGILLLHGLSDSPYGLRSWGEMLFDLGFHVVGLRLPGHGTSPSGLLDVTWQDWVEAVRLAARHIEDRIGPDLPSVWCCSRPPSGWRVWRP